MSSISDIAEAYREGKKLYKEVLLREVYPHFMMTELYGENKGEILNTVAEGDSLEYMDHLIKDKHMAKRFQLIYVDPPFFSKSRYQASFCVTSRDMKRSPVIKVDAYDDSRSGNMHEYLKMITARLLMMKELLKETGCICVHLDWHAVHYVKIIMDEIFGRENFINEIIWTYKSGGSSRKSFSRKHDTLLLYGRSEKYKFNPQQEKSYNRDLKPYRFKGVEEFCDEKGWYTKVNMKDVWNIDMVGRTSKERTGYATQKPEKLMERIIRACSDEGDLCGDFFAGSGSFGVVCGREKRRFVMCDKGGIALADEITRLSKENISFGVEKHSKISDKSDDICAEVEISSNGSEVRLRDYRFNKKICGISDSEFIKYIETDGLCAVKAWSVDFDFDGNVHRADRLLDGSARDFSICNAAGRAVEDSNISVVCYDVLGNSAHMVKYAKRR